MRASDRVLEILETLGIGEVLTLTEIAGQVELPVPTVHRLLAALEERGWITRLPSGGYTLGPQFLAAASRATQRDPIVAAASTNVAQLAAELDETVSLSVASGLRRVCLVESESTQALRYVHGVGSVGPLHAGASSKVLVAFGEPSLLEKVCIAPMEHFTEITLDAEALRHECKRVRQQGWAMSLGERSRGALALAVPLISPRTGITYALTVFAPEARVPQGAQENWLEALRRTSAAILSELATPTSAEASAR